MLEVLYGTGLRVSELTQLMINNMYFDIGFIRVTGKGNKERLVPIGRDAIKYLEIYINEIRVHVPDEKGRRTVRVPEQQGVQDQPCFRFYNDQGCCCQCWYQKKT